MSDELAAARDRRQVREWYWSFSLSLERVLTTYASDYAKRRKINTDNLTVPWKRCDTHAFIYLYGRICPLCLEDGHLSAL